MLKTNNKIMVILGPTASGKTSLGVALARQFNGEIVSADSRQVYRGMDIGTGKDLKEYEVEIKNYKVQITNEKKKIIKVPYHLIDVVSPNTEFNLAKYQKLAYKAIDDILSRGKLPVLVGGSGLYLEAVIEGYDLKGIKPDKQLREQLERLNISELFTRLKKLNSKMAERINESDRKNKRRLVRYIELAKGDGFGGRIKVKKYEPLMIGLSWPKEIIEKRIYKRLIERLEKEDMVGEVRALHKRGVSWKRLESFGLEYKYTSLFLQKKLPYDEMVEKLFIAIRQFAKRQMTWFKRWEKQGAEIKRGRRLSVGHI